MRFVFLFIWFTTLHVIGLVLYCHGFLLTRAVSDCFSDPTQHSFEPVFSRAVIVIIDALRYDFVTPQPGSTSHYHNAFPVLHTLATEAPANAFLLPFIADPPTTTLQRLKGLTTGSLPTFIDAGSNFAGTEILEDNIILQLKSSGHRLAFVGDDTWLALFPNAFEEQLCFPFESLNVWDLHTVDEGVATHLHSMIKSESDDWDIAIAHTLGVDHVGHKYGPDHPEMQQKLQQMNSWIFNLTECIDDKTLLIVMGDHGMDPKGDHGGDSLLEVQAALWMYSRQGVFSDNEQETMRSVSQIDFVPTISLLLGIPIPFNNLGAPIMEAFSGTGGLIGLSAAMHLTTAQLYNYTEYYIGNGGSSLAFDSALSELRAAKEEGNNNYECQSKFQQELLATYRGLWAQYNLITIYAGILVLTLALFCLGGMLNSRLSWTDNSLRGILLETYAFFFIGLLLGYGAHFALSTISAWYFAIFTAAIFSAVSFLRHVFPFRSPPANVWSALATVLLSFYSLLFASNSFVIWEDRIVLYLINTFGVFAMAYSSKIENQTRRTIAFVYSTIFVMLSRTNSLSHSCRDEQGPQCVSTFSSTSTNIRTSQSSLILVLLSAILLPLILRDFLRSSHSFRGSAIRWVGIIIPAELGLVVLYFILDSTAGFVVQRLTLSQFVLSSTLLGANMFWYHAPLSIDLSYQKADRDQPAHITVYGSSNILGSDYVLFLLNWLPASFMLAKPLGMVSLSVLVWQLLLLVEIACQIGLPRSGIIVPVVLALMAHLHFFTTGHQMSLPFIQWDTAFVASSRVVYPFSPTFVVWNAFAAFILVTIAIPIFGLWKQKLSSSPVLLHCAWTNMGYLMVMNLFTLSSVVWAAWFRRHLMVWKIFAPRFMCASLILLVTDIFVVANCFASRRTKTKVIGFLKQVQ